MASLPLIQNLAKKRKRRRPLTTTAMAMEITRIFVGSSLKFRLDSQLFLTHFGIDRLFSLNLRVCHRRLKTSVSSVGKSSNGVSGITRVGVSSISAVRLPRRMFMQLAGLGSVLTLLDFPGLAAPVPEMKEPEVIRILKFPSGVRIQEILEGQGPEAHEGDLVELNYVCRRANGYFVHSTVDQFSGESSPVKLFLDENDVIEGLKEVLVGMKPGGKRRALIPPSVGYINETLKPIPEEFGPRRSLLSHANEPLVFEVQLLKVF